MDRDKVVFLFGELPLGADPDDQETRHGLVREPLADNDLSVVDAFVVADRIDGGPQTPGALGVEGDFAVCSYRGLGRRSARS